MTKPRRRIGVVTGGRADYGPLFWVLRGIQNDPSLELLLFVTGMHLSREFGLTIRNIEEDGFPITDRVEMLLGSDSREAVATAMGLGMIGLGHAFAVHRPDVLVVLGDRFEILAAAAAAMPLRIPVAHIHGGESTEGAFDDAARHAITKLSQLHFASTREYADRIIQMGEPAERVFAVGAPSLDHIHRTVMPARPELLASLGIGDANRRLGVITYHPATLESGDAGSETEELLAGVASFPDLTWVATLPNADPGGRAIRDRLVNDGPRLVPGLVVQPSLGSARYLALLRESVVMVGNSSSGIIEAPSFGLPVVNLGGRERGRVRGANVIDVPEVSRHGIERAVRKALTDEFRRTAAAAKNPYGDGQASGRIVAVLRDVKLDEGLLRKTVPSRPGGQ